MGEDRSWMYSGWDKGENYTYKWMDKATIFWTVLSHCQRLCCAHVADARIRGAWRTRQPMPYTCVRMVSCQAMRYGNFTASQVLES
jgi:hypothetical protein